MTSSSNHISIVTVTYANKAEAIASQALAETMMEKIALKNGCKRIRCYMSGESTRMVLFEYDSEETQMKVVDALGDYTKIHSEAFQIKMVTVRGTLLSDSIKDWPQKLILVSLNFSGDGAGEEIRTLDIFVGNEMLYHWATPAR